MRAGWGVGVVLALALSACRSRDAGSADAGFPPPPEALTCEGLVSLEVRDALPGFSFKEERPCASCGPLCVFRSAEQKDVSLSIAYDCRKRFEGEDLQALLIPTLKAGGMEVPAMGKAAARREPVPGMLQVSAWDDDTPCGIVVTWLGPDRDRALDIARMTLFATTPERLTQAATSPNKTSPHAPGDAGTPLDAGTP
ncbi:hypothetical protein [Melittangium boletus]|uniref:Lipoprotein n=1 Tax=Melittangium boletus DSM 14713 TaxID=1294270 RepID=A0A250IJQ1_9BACT|nr:hypothetical protein [Melittangium boletus]ATB31387.1 lipoprotein [Melittangium boletus DSM 14713]